MNNIIKLNLILWTLVFLVRYYAARKPGHALARAAFTWFGPFPISGEWRSHFQMRRASYAFGWLSHFALALALSVELGDTLPDLRSAGWLMALDFALVIGLGMALLSMIGFLAKAAQIRLSHSDCIICFPDALPAMPPSEAGSFEDVI
jgi:hypothetical protein